MRMQDLFVEITERVSRDVIRAARCTPPDRLTWAPDGARSTLEILQEVADSPMWVIAIALKDEMPTFTAEQMEAYAAAARALDTIDKCEAKLQENLGKLRDFIAAFPDERLDERMALPFSPGLVMSRAEILLTQYWNATYHLGQICYLQTMLGDQEMH